MPVQSLFPSPTGNVGFGLYEVCTPEDTLTTRRQQISMKLRVEEDVRDRLHAKADELGVSVQHILEALSNAVVLGLGDEIEHALKLRDPMESAQRMTRAFDPPALDGDLGY